MAALKSGKKELFCQKWLELDNKSEAYRQSHPASKRWKPETIHNKASALSKEDEVAARFRELQELAGAKHGITIAMLIKELEEAREAALYAETPQGSAAVSATMAKAKLCGFDKQVIDHTSSDGSMSPSGLTPEQAAQARKQMLEQDDC